MSSDVRPQGTQVITEQHRQLPRIVGLLGPRGGLLYLRVVSFALLLVVAAFSALAIASAIENHERRSAIALGALAVIAAVLIVRGYSRAKKAIIGAELAGQSSRAT